MNITHQHLQHAYHQAAHHKKIADRFKDKFSSFTESGVSLLEVGAGAFLGGLLEGRTAQGTFMHVPLNLAAGIGLVVAGVGGFAGDASPHLSNLGEGFISSYAAAAGYSVGKKWRDTGKLFGAGGAIGGPSAAPQIQAPAVDPAAMAAAMQAAIPAG